MNQNTNIAGQYFDAFHNGRIDEVLGYFEDGGTVQYGTEPAKKASEFFVETKEMISQLMFETHGYSSSPQTSIVIIHFSFEMPNEGGGSDHIEAIDLIEFSEANKIMTVKVITNS